MKIAVIGHGNVGGALAAGLRRAGHVVTIATADPGSPSVAAALARDPDLRVAPPESALPGADAVILAVPFGAAADVVSGVRGHLAGTVLIDCTNPVGPGLSHGLDSARSGSELIQSLAPDARVVKAFSVYGAENLADPAYPGYDVQPAMFFCGDDVAAKATVAQLIADLGWEPLDVGGLVQALHLEHMTLLWVRMVRMDGHSPGLVWAALRR